MNDIEILKKIVCDEMDITIEDFENNLSRQFRKYVIPRQIIFYILKNYENMTITAIGKLLNKDHATVVYSCKVIQNLIDTDKFLREKILNCEKKYKNNLCNYECIEFEDLKTILLERIKNNEYLSENIVKNYNKFIAHGSI